jgi:hypothetical protein
MAVLWIGGVLAAGVAYIVLRIFLSKKGCETCGVVTDDMADGICMECWRRRRAHREVR